MTQLMNKTWKFSAVLAISALIFTGCGSGDSASPEQAENSPPKITPGESNETPSKTKELQTVSINPPTQQTEPDLPKQGSPEWILMEIAELHEKAFPATNNKVALNEARRSRSEAIVAKATQVIKMTHDNKEKEEVFTIAVNQLMEASLNLALLGDKEAQQALYEHAVALHKRSPKSDAAIIASLALSRYIHTNARLYAKKEPRWLKELAKQARLFATNFPEQEAEAISLLYSAGRSCELHGLSDDAEGCYSLVAHQYPKSESPQALQVASFLRRMNLKGESLQLAGPTIEGGWVSIDDFKGKVVLVVFWDSKNTQWLKQVEKVEKIAKKYKQYGLEVIGINLDKEEPDVESFLEKHSLTWQQIFYSDKKNRRWDNPIVKYYGVRTIPAMWLVDHEGKVVSEKIQVDALEKEVRRLITESRKKE